MASSEGFPAVDAEKQLNPGQNKDVQVDPISSEVAASTESKEEAKEEKKQEKETKECQLQAFKTGIIVSGFIVAAAGAVFAVTKKLKEK